jgi:hypothetical protein
MLLDICKSTPNEIVYVESGSYPLKPSIYKRQLKYFQKVREDCRVNPGSSVSAIILQGIDQNTPFIRHYKKLENKFTSPQDCFNHFIDEHKQQIELKIRRKFHDDPDSILGTYNRVNPNLQAPIFNKDVVCNESDRRTITRYRVGCHMLKIQAGRLTGEGRDTRLCTCQRDIQTLSHVLFTCPITENIRQAHGLQSTNLQQFFENGDFLEVATMLKAVAKQLKL